MSKATEGRIVKFTPSKGTLEKFKNKKKDTYPAIVTEVNDDTVDLTVFGVGEQVHVKNIKHVSEAAETRSHWDWNQSQ